MADFLEVDNAEVFDGDMEEENISRLKVHRFLFRGQGYMLLLFDIKKLKFNFYKSIVNLNNFRFFILAF